MKTKGEKQKWVGPYTRPRCAVLSKHRPGWCIGFADIRLVLLTCYLEATLFDLMFLDM
jgi:hypothetical protein